mmetsp:Transcript_10210/g.41280  ORF Transcript_10210/g.41280 Transcript_10210/m.41280 type:complete len:356 (-) Transcript_10210:35-1102(-)
MKRKLVLFSCGHGCARGDVLLLLLGLELLVHDLVLDGRRRPPFRHVPTLPSLPVHRPRADAREGPVDHPVRLRRQHPVHDHRDGEALGEPLERVALLHLYVLHADVEGVVHEREHRVAVGDGGWAVPAQVADPDYGVRPIGLVRASAGLERRLDELLGVDPSVQRGAARLGFAADHAGAHHRLSIHELPGIHVPSFDADVRQDHDPAQLGHGASLDAVAEVDRGLEQRRRVLRREDHAGRVLQATLEQIRGLVDALDRVQGAEAVDHRFVGEHEVLRHGVERVLDADVGVVGQRHLDRDPRAALVLAELIDAALSDALAATRDEDDVALGVHRRADEDRAGPTTRSGPLHMERAS